MILERKSRASASNVSSLNFLFSESMRKTQEAIQRCSLCFCCEANEADRYGQEMLANEIDTLKRTIKQVRAYCVVMVVHTRTVVHVLVRPCTEYSVMC